MRLLAKNATAPALALAAVMAGSSVAVAQSVREQDLPSVPGAPRAAMPETRPPSREHTPRESPHRDPEAAKSRPLLRDNEGERGGAAPAERPRTGDGDMRGGMWAGTPYLLLAETLPRLPVRMDSAVLRSLAIEVLASDSEPAEGPALARRLAALRAERLYAMGRLEEAEAAFASAAIPAGDQARGPAEIETRLLLRGPAAGCGTVFRHLAARPSPYLERAAIACHALTGDHAKAALGLGLLREQGHAVGDAFPALVLSQQRDLAQPITSFGRADAWTVSLLAATELPWPDDAVRIGVPALLRVIADSDNDPVALRIAAAERGLLLGAVGRERLVRLYAAPRFSAEALGRGARLTLAQYSPLGRALLYQAAAATDGRARLDALAQWWRLARVDRSEVLAALVTVPMLGSVAPDAQWREHAGAISRVFFHAGDFDRALAWYGWMRAAAFKDLEAQLRLGALARLAGAGTDGWSPADARAWAEWQRGSGGDAAERRIALLRALEEGLDEGTARRANTVAGQVGRVDDQFGAEWRGVMGAARAGRRGEAILLLLAAIGHDGLDQAKPNVLGTAVGALTALGRRTEARRLAVEAALANGF